MLLYLKGLFGMEIFFALQRLSMVRKNAVYAVSFGSSFGLGASA